MLLSRTRAVVVSPSGVVMVIPIVHPRRSWSPASVGFMSFHVIEQHFTEVTLAQEALGVRSSFRARIEILYRPKAVLYLRESAGMPILQHGSKGIDRSLKPALRLADKRLLALLPLFQETITTPAPLRSGHSLFLRTAAGAGQHTRGPPCVLRLHVLSPMRSDR